MNCGLSCELRAYLQKFLREGVRFIEYDTQRTHYSLWRAMHDLGCYIFNEFERHCPDCDGNVYINEVFKMSAIRDKEIFGTVELDIDGSGDNQSLRFLVEFSANGSVFWRNTNEYFGLDDSNVAKLRPLFDEALAEADKLPESTRHGDRIVIEHISYETLRELQKSGPAFYQKLYELGD